MTARIDTAAERARLDALAGHTPGPWGYRMGDVCANGGDGDDIVLAGVGRSCGARSHEYTLLRPKSPQHAVNGQVMAAAPYLLSRYHAALDEIDRLTAALAEVEKIDQEDLHFVMSHPEAVAREMAKLRRQVAEAEDRGAAQMRERAAKTALGQAAADGLVDDTRLIAATLAIRALPLRETGATP